MKNLFPAWVYALYAVAICGIGVWASAWGLDFYTAISWTRTGYAFLLVWSICGCVVWCFIALALAGRDL